MGLSDITTDTAVTLHSGGWYYQPCLRGFANIAVVLTFNRPADRVNALRELTADPSLTR